MFEVFKPRAEAIDQEKFNEFLRDQEFLKLVSEVESTMSFYSNEEGEEGDTAATASGTEPGYELALDKARNWLDKKGVRISNDALARAIAKKMDPDDSSGYKSLA